MYYELPFSTSRQWHYETGERIMAMEASSLTVIVIDQHVVVIRGWLYFLHHNVIVLSLTLRLRHPSLLSLFTDFPSQTIQNCINGNEAPCSPYASRAMQQQRRVFASMSRNTSRFINLFLPALKIEWRRRGIGIESLLNFTMNL
jgi:hypothetical protein